MTKINNENIKYRSIASMSRGKAVEVGLRYALINGIHKTDILDAQMFGSNYFEVNKKRIPDRFYNRYKKQIPSMIREGIKILVNIEYNKNIKPKPIIISQGSKKLAFPDFETKSIKIAKKIIKNPIIELKTGEKIDHARVLRDAKQAIKYTKSGKRNCILIYLITKKPRKKFDLYSADSYLFIVSQAASKPNKINFLEQLN